MSGLGAVIQGDVMRLGTAIFIRSYKEDSEIEIKEWIWYFM